MSSLDPSPSKYQIFLNGSQIPNLISPNTAVKSKQRYLWFYWEQTYYHRKLLCCSVSLLPQTFLLKLFTPIWTKGFWNSFKLHYKKVSDWFFRYFSWYFYCLQELAKWHNLIYNILTISSYRHRLKIKISSSIILCVNTSKKEEEKNYYKHNLYSTDY